ncbi:MAG: DUF4956 domain-containing protein [Planctomycetota bacterium]|jgi:uncharacterized membrane protein YhiD involved in acid resistance
MDRLWEVLEGTPLTGGVFTPENVLLSLLLSFVLGVVIAIVYYYTHSGLSYSRTYVQSLVLVTIVVAMVMAVIGDNIIRAFGLIIRFRNVVKDTRDIVFIFCSLVVGMACGSQRFFVAIVGCLFLCSIAVYLHLTRFGTHEPHNGFLRFTVPTHIGPEHPMPRILKNFCSSFSLISAHDAGVGAEQVEYSYQLMIRSAKKNEKMLSEIEGVEGISNITLTMQEQLLEV